MRTRFISLGRNPAELLVLAAIPSALFSASVFAQSAPQGLADQPQRVEPVIVTGNLFGARDLARPDSILTGDLLSQKLRSTLGETLAQLPGISSSYFGPTASRPIIRGLDGERVRVLENGAASVDAAALSPDHAVPIDPIAVARIEVLRGPAALIYGSNAVGGVVNAISNRIPRAAALGNTALVNASAESVDRSSALAARVDGVRGGWGVHVDATHRESSDVRTPKFTLTDGEVRDRIHNSAAKTQSGAVGISKLWNGGFLGASVDGFNSTYGIAATDGVTIDMRKQKAMIAGETTMDWAGISQVSGHLAWTQYAHDEIEPTGEIGTKFRNRGLQWRIEGKTQRVGNWQSVAGISGEQSRFTAQGEEAFVPPNRTENFAFFGMARAEFGASVLSFGGRLERALLKSEEVRNDDGELRFGGADQRNLWLKSISASISRSLDAGWSARALLSQTERAPTYFERYADGVHIATNAIEVGDRDLPNERAAHFEIGAAWKRAENSLQLNAYVSRFRNFIALEATGETRTEAAKHAEDEALPVYAFRAVPAQFVGAEIDGNWRVVRGATNVDLFGKWDIVRAKNRATAEPLARIAPMRATLGSAVELARWKVSVEAMRVWRQNRVPASERIAAESGEGATPGYTMINAFVSTDFEIGKAMGKIMLRGTNLSNALAFNASSIQSVRERVPLPGRSVMLSVEIAL